MSPSAPRVWWRHPAVIIALLLHGAIFFGLFQLRLPAEAWREMERGLPEHPSTAQWYDALTRAHGYWGLVSWFFDTHQEIRLYRRYAEVAVRGIDVTLAEDARDQGRLRLYQDVPMEYQPGALLMFVPPAWVARTVHGYETAFTAWCGIVYIASVLLGMRLLAGDRPITVRQATRTLLWSVAFLLCFGGVAAARFDHAVPFCCLAAYWAFRCAQRQDSLRWYAVCGAIVAGGVMVKIVPGLVLAAALLWLCVLPERWQWRAPAALVAGFAVASAGLHLTFVAQWGDGYLRSYTYHVARGIQIESTFSGILMAAHGFGTPISTRLQFGACDLISDYAGLAKRVSPLLFFAVCIATAARWWFLRRTQPHPPRELALVLLTSVLLLGFILTNKVLSPQYLLWLGPLVACAYGVRRSLLLPALLLLLAAAESQLLFPHLYDGLLELKPGVIALLNLRNVTLLVLFAVLLWRLPRLLAPAADDTG